MAPMGRRPFEVILDTTERCNLRCTMCYFSTVDRLQFPPFDRQLSKRGMMPTEMFSRIAADLFPRARKVALACAAEPLIHPKFVDIVREAGRHGVPDLWFPTNLLPLTPKKAEAICEAGVRTVAVSMDGTHPGTYEAIRVGGTFDRLTRSLELLNRVRRGTSTRLRLIFVWMRTNRHDLADLPRFAEEVGASELDVRFVMPTAHAPCEDELLDGEDPSQLRAELAACAEDSLSRRLRLVSFPDFDHGRVGLRGHLMRFRAGLHDWPRLRGRIRSATGGCAWPNHTVVVRPNGAVSPCIFWEEQPVGLYPETSLDELQSSPGLVQITDGLRSGNPCGTCRTCSERRDGLYYRMKRRAAEAERGTGMFGGGGPGSGGIAGPVALPDPVAASDPSAPGSGAACAVDGVGSWTGVGFAWAVAGAPTARDAGVASGDGPATTAATAATAASKPDSPPSAFPGTAEWIRAQAPAMPFDRVLLLGDEARAADLIHAGFARGVDVGSPSIASFRGCSSSLPPSVRRVPLHPHRPAFPRTYPAVVSVGGFSTCLRLERLLDALLDAIAPGGRLFVDDYVGPARHRWNVRRTAAAQAALDALPAAARLVERLPAPPESGDCARAIRSDDVMRLLQTGFKVESALACGGDLVARLGDAVDWSGLPPSEVKRLIEGSGSGRAHYALAAATPSSGFQRRLASLRYRHGPKIRRVFVYEPRRARDLLVRALRRQDRE